MPFPIRAASAFMLFGTLLSAADPQLISLVMPDARLVGGVNVSQARSTPFGRFLLDRVQAGDNGFSDFVTATGFDPRRDLVEVVLASATTTGDKGVLLARGSFDTERITTLMRGAGKTPEIYGGVEIIGGRQESHAVAFLDGTTAIAGDAESVKAAIDRRTRPTRLDPALLAKIDELSASQHIWGVTVAPLAGLSAQAPDQKMSGMLQGDLFKTVERASAGLKFGPTVRLSAEAVAHTEKDAAALADALKFLVNLAGMQSQKSPGLDWAALAQSLKLSSESNTVRMAIEIPEADFEKLIQSRGEAAPPRNP